MIYIHESTQKHIDELVQLLNKERKEKKLIIKANKELTEQLSLCSVSNWVRFEDNKPTLNERYLLVWDTYPPETRIWKKEDEDKDYSGLRWLPIPKWK